MRGTTWYAATHQELSYPDAVHKEQAHDGEDEVGSSPDGGQPDGIPVTESSHLGGACTTVPAQ